MATLVPVAHVLTHAGRPALARHPRLVRGSRS